MNPVEGDDAVFLPPEDIQFNFDDLDNFPEVASSDLSSRTSEAHFSSFNVDSIRIPRSASTMPISIPGGGARQPSQRHTNFTPPRSYMVANPIALKVVRSASAGNLPTAVSVLLGEQIRPGCLSVTGNVPKVTRAQPCIPRRVIADQVSKSVPNFDRCALEQDIGMELRAISDNFHLECGGFKHGYDFKSPASRVYPSSYPGSTRLAGQSAGWQQVVMAVSPNQCNALQALLQANVKKY